MKWHTMKTMRYSVIDLAGTLHILVRGEHTLYDLHEAIRSAGRDPRDFQVGPLQRFRKWPNRKGGYCYNVNKSRSTVGSFYGRLVRPCQTKTN